MAVDFSGLDFKTAGMVDAVYDEIERLIEAAYLTMTDFEDFVAVAFLYFATVSFAEMRQRLIEPAAGESQAWSGFLGAGDPDLEVLFAANPDALMFGTDLPSTRAARPYSDRDFQLVVDTLGDTAARRVLHDNAAAFYRVGATGRGDG